MAEGEVKVADVGVDSVSEGEGKDVPFAEAGNLVSVEPSCSVKHIVNSIASDIGLNQKSANFWTSRSSAPRV